MVTWEHIVTWLTMGFVGGVRASLQACEVRIGGVIQNAHSCERKHGRVIV